MPLFLVVLGAVLGVVGSGAILLWWNSHQLPIVSGGYSLYHRSERGEMRADTALWKTVLYDDLRNCRITTTILTSPEGMSVAEDSFKILTLKILIRNDGRSAATNLKLSFAAHFFDLDFVGIRPHVPHAYSTSKDTLLGIFEHSVELTSLSPGDEKFLTFSAHLDNKELATVPQKRLRITIPKLSFDQSVPLSLTQTFSSYMLLKREHGTIGRKFDTSGRTEFTGTKPGKWGITMQKIEFENNPSLSFTGTCGYKGILTP